MKAIQSKKKIILLIVFAITIIVVLGLLYVRFSGIYPKNESNIGDSQTFVPMSRGDSLRSRGIEKLKNGNKDEAIKDLQNAKQEYIMNNDKARVAEVNQQLDYAATTPSTQAPSQSDPEVKEEINSSTTP